MGGRSKPGIADVGVMELVCDSVMRIAGDYECEIGRDAVRSARAVHYLMNVSHRECAQ